MCPYIVQMCVKGRDFCVNNVVSLSLGRSGSHHSVGRGKLQAFIFLCSQQVEELDQTRKDILKHLKYYCGIFKYPSKLPQDDG